jgi:hypothetical protein
MRIRYFHSFTAGGTPALQRVRPSLPISSNFCVAHPTGIPGCL